MSYQTINESYIQPQYSMLQNESKDSSANFSEELMRFLNKHPEFSKTSSHLEFLRYCFDYYINCDPLYRDLPIQDKLKEAGEMAKNFMGIVIGAKG